MAKKHLKDVRAEVHGMDDQQLAAEFKAARASLFTLRTRAVTEKVENNAEFGRQRRHIARLLTERRARQIAREAGKGR
jgi:ribosomal protein L29